MKSPEILRKDNYINLILLTIIIFISIVEYLLVKPRIIQSDDILYINSAISIIEGNFKLTASVFTERFGVFLPVVLFYKIFGVNAYTSTIYLLISSIVCSVFIFYLGNKIKNGLGVLAAFLFVCNPVIVSLTVDLLPDMFCATFILIAIYFLFATINDENLSKERIRGFLFSVFLFLSVFIKEYLVFYLPFILFICIKRYKTNYRFWNTFFLASAVLIILAAIFYQIETGSIFYRLNAIELEHDSSVWSFHFRTTSLLIGRILLGLYEFFLRNYEFTALIIFTVPVLLFKSRAKNEETLKFWIYNFIILFIVFQYGSTSLKSYNPLPLQPRMFICLFPSMCILAAYAIQEIFYNKSSEWIYSAMNIALISALVCLSNYYFYRIYLFIFFAVYAVLLLILFFKKPQIKITLLIFSLIFLSVVLISAIINLPGYKLININFIFSIVILIALFLTLVIKKPQLRIALIILPLICISIYFNIKQRPPVDHTSDLYNNYIGKLTDNSLVLMFKRNFVAHKYYNYYNSNHLIFMDWRDVFKDSSATKRSNNIYLFVDFDKVKSSNKYYKTYSPKFINKMPLNWKTIKEYYRYAKSTNGNVKSLGLYQVSSLKELKKYY